MKTEKKILTANLINAAGMLLCENDLPLEFGDIIEIQEREYRLDEQRVGLTGDEGGACYKCTVRNVSVVVKGETTTLKLGPNSFGAYLAATMKQPNVRQILRSSSDLSRLRIRRLADPATGQPAREWTVDLETFQRSGATHWEDLWLRDGDVIEVPDRE